MSRIARWLAAGWLAAAVLAAGPALPAIGQIEPQQESQLAAISPHLADQLAAGSGPVSFLVVLRDQVDAEATLQAAEEAAGAAPLERTARITALYRELTRRAAESQAPVVAWLDAQSIPYRAFYIANMIEVRGDVAVAQALRGFAEVDRLSANPLVAGQEARVSRPAADSWLQEASMEGRIGATPAQSADELPYGLTDTHAPDVWKLGYRGQGIVVASQDTGVKWDHPALVDRYRGWKPAQIQADHVYNWFDAWGENSCTSDPQIPCDDNGHGTHTVGTMVGDATADGYGIIGMAPGAQWIGCRNMLYGEGTPASYAACFEFMLAPYPQGGDPFSDGRPELAPHIINNSWSCPPEEGCDRESLRRVVETVRSAGQLVVASAGNYGPSCSTVQYPISMYDAVFSVGAHDISGMLAGFSSRGPVNSDGSGRLKPDLTAPGVFVLSATPGGYGYLSGTSMSAPHVAGAAALLWSAAPELIGDVDLTEQVLIKSATPVSDSHCLPSLTPVSPNPAYGYGRLDVYTAVQMALAPWQAAIQVADAEDKPQDQVRVALVDELTGYLYTARTGFDGVARLPRVYAGSYTMRVGEGGGAVRIPGIQLKLGSATDGVERRYVRRVVYEPFTASEWIYYPTLIWN